LCEIRVFNFSTFSFKWYLADEWSHVPTQTRVYKRSSLSFHSSSLHLLTHHHLRTTFYIKYIPIQKRKYTLLYLYFLVICFIEPFLIITNILLHYSYFIILGYSLYHFWRWFGICTSLQTRGSNHAYQNEKFAQT